MKPRALPGGSESEALADEAVDAHHEFGAQLFGIPEGRRVGIDHALRQAVMIAQVDEQHAAVVADSVAPARKAHGLPGLGEAERAASVGAVSMHGGSFSAGDELRRVRSGKERPGEGRVRPTSSPPRKTGKGIGISPDAPCFAVR